MSREPNGYVLWLSYSASECAFQDTDAADTLDHRHLHYRAPHRYSLLRQSLESEIPLYRAWAAEGEVPQLLGEGSHHGGRLERNGVIHPRRQNGTLEAGTKGRVRWQHPTDLQ